MTDPNGTTWEIFTAGYRSPYDFAFDADGEMFVYDADMEWDVGRPSHPPPRVNHATSGSELGWRSGSGKWAPALPDSLPACVDIGPGSPVGVTFGHGAKFPAKYQKALHICDWTFGTMYAIHLEPAGSTYKAVKEQFVSRTPLPLTDAVVGVDGAMYFTVGGRGGQSELYRVTYAGPEPTVGVDLRKAAAIGVARQAEPAAQPAVLAALDAIDPAKLDVAGTIDLARAYELAIVRLGDPAADAKARIASRLAPLSPSGSFDRDREPSSLLVGIRAPGIVSKLCGLLAAPSASANATNLTADEDELRQIIARNAGYGGAVRPSLEKRPDLLQIHYAYALRVAREKEAWKIDDIKAYHAWFKCSRDWAGGHHGTVHGAKAHAQGVAGRARLFFRNEGNHVEVPYHKDFDIPSFTVSAWIWLTEPPTYSGILGTRHGGDATFDMKVNAEQVHGDIGTGDAWIETKVNFGAADVGTDGQGGRLQTGRWYHVT